MPRTTQYRVLKHFQWGVLKFEKGQLLIIEERPDGDDDVYEKHHPQHRQRVNRQTNESMVLLKKIEKY